ncbi:MAG: phosphoribosylformylglycinamidine synthase subunit PurL [Candidatus Paceibacterota bacterium]
MLSRIYVKPKGKATIMSSYLISHQLGKDKILKIANALTNQTIEEFSINKFPEVSGFSYAIEVGFLPGVTDNAAHSTKETITDLLHLKENAKLSVYTSKIFLTNKKNSAQVKEFAATLYNPLIERVYLASKQELKIKKDFPRKELKVILKKSEPVIIVPLSNANETALSLIGKEGISEKDGTRRGPLALDLNSMKVIQNHFNKLNREPTDIELEALAQTWSEHCKHTIFANPIDNIADGLYRTYIKGATNLIRKNKGKNDFCVSVFSDNSGGIVFDENYLITHKVETHNSPSALDPFGGAITGIVGVNRDTVGFGLGAKPVANVYGFCFGYPEDKAKYFRDPALTQPMLPPARIIDGVVKGINVGGNCSGIPTLSGFVKFDDRYRGKPLVFAGTVGLIPRKSAGRMSHLKAAGKGDYIVMLGGRVGLDGIHGATFSSVALDSKSPAAAVQIGDPITQKKLSDAIVKEARDRKLYRSITDNGAGGLSCSVAEMAKESGGAEVDLEKVPLKYPGLRPWEIWISESQERMTLSVPREKWKEFEKLMRSRSVEATIIGQFTDSGSCVVKYGGKKIMDIDMEFLHNGLPTEHLRTTQTYVKNTEPKIELASYEKALENLLARKNISGFAFISEQYDHEVQASSVLKPLAGPGRINTDAQVFRPVLSSLKGAVLTSSTYPSYGDISTYHMAAAAIDTAIRNAVAAGGSLSHLAILDNFCWCSSNDPVRLGQLVDAVKACYDYAVSYDTPFISGKDSMFNDFKGYDEKGAPVAISIPPTLLISAIGVMSDLRKTISPEFKRVGDSIYILGDTNDEMGGGELYRMAGFVGENVPKVDARKNLKTYKVLEQTIKKELLASSISLTSGGLAIALAKASLGGMLGADISLKNLPGRAQTTLAKLFSESQGRVVVSVNPKDVRTFEKIIKDIPHAKLGKVSKNDILTISDNKQVVKTAIKKLHNIYHKFSNSMQ